LFLPSFVHSWLYLFLPLNSLIFHVILCLSFCSFLILCFILCTSIFIMSFCIVRTTSLYTTRPSTIICRLLLNWASLRRH
jgi:hypothetical protein